MSADNGIYILETPLKDEFEYRVIHAQAIDNLDYHNNGDIFDKSMLFEYFKNSPVFIDYNAALGYARELEENCDYIEYGICEIEKDYEFPYFEQYELDYINEIDHALYSYKVGNSYLNKKYYKIRYEPKQECFIILDNDHEIKIDEFNVSILVELVNYHELLKLMNTLDVTYIKDVLISTINNKVEMFKKIAEKLNSRHNRFNRNYLIQYANWLEFIQVNFKNIQIINISIYNHDVEICKYEMYGVDNPINTFYDVIDKQCRENKLLKTSYIEIEVIFDNSQVMKFKVENFYENNDNVILY